MHQQAIPSKKRIPIELISTIPSKFTPESLRPQLINAGLPCGETASDAQLQAFIDRGVDEFVKILQDKTGLKAYEYTETLPKDSNLASARFVNKNIRSRILQLANGEYTELKLLTHKDTEVNYKPAQETGGWSNELYTILNKTNFEHLEQLSKDDPSKYVFHGQRGGPNKTEEELKTDDAIISVFAEAAAAAAQIYPVDGGVNKDAMEAAMKNTIGPNINSSRPENYRDTGDKNLLLVDRYDPKTKESRGIGAINISWELTIKDYKRKEKNGGDTHKVTITVSARGVFYDDICVLCRDYKEITQIDSCAEQGIKCSC